MINEIIEVFCGEDKVGGVTVQSDANGVFPSTIEAAAAPVIFEYLKANPHQTVRVEVLYTWQA